jgi:competence protein ComEC
MTRAVILAKSIVRSPRVAPQPRRRFASSQGKAVRPFTLVLCAFSAVTGTLALAGGLPDGLRGIVAAGCIAVCGFAASPWCEPRLRVLLPLVLAGAGLNAGIRAQTNAHVTERRTARYAGTMLDRSVNNAIVALDGGPRVLAHLRNDPPAPGTRVVVRGRLTPFDDARNPGEPSEASIQHERGIDAQLDAAAVLSVSPGSPWDSRTWLPRAHEWAHAQLRDRVGEPQASVLAGELWGERSALPPDLRVEFQETGTVHVLVTAGLHLGAVAALCLFLFSALALPRAATCAIAATFIWAFVWWSGGQLPSVRAAAMATAALAARACGRATFSWNGLAIGALAVTFARPESVASASFALSFSCVGAIFAVASPLERWIERVAALPVKLREALVLSLATQIGTWPLTAAVFLQFSPYALAANLAVVPCVAATMALGAAQLFFAWLPFAAAACANLNSWVLAWMLGVVQTLSAMPAAAVPMTPAPVWCIMLYDLALVTSPLLISRKATTNALAALLIATTLVLAPPRADDHRLRITMLDVGQADSILVQTPAGHAFLVDAGGRLERGPQNGDSVAELVGERIVVPFLLRAGVHKLDALLISHPHGDHVGGCAPVLRKVRVAEIADSGQAYGGHAYHDCLDTAAADRVPVVRPRVGMVWRTDDGVTLTFVGPSLPFIEGKNAINDNSIAFVLQYGSFRMLFTGDAGVAAERRFLEEGIDLHANVLKVGHHGSAYSSSPDFIGAVRPSYAIISVGRHNLFGHPAPSTIATLQSFGAKVYRTDEDAAVSVVADGSTFEVSPFLSTHPNCCRR